MGLYLSRMLLDPLHRTTVSALRDVYKLHELAMDGFKGHSDVGRVLFRLEPEQRGRALPILVQSQVEPFWDSAPQWLLDVQSRPIGLDFARNDLMPFRLRANTVVTRNGKRLGLVHEQALRDWLQRRADAIGAEFLGFDVADEGYRYGKKPGGNNSKGRRLAFKSTRFDGRLRVSDPEAFARKVAQGVGPGKGFGHGLLSVRHPR